MIVLVLLRRCRFKRKSVKPVISDSTVSRPNPKVYKSEIEYVRANLRKVRNTVSATNPLSVADSTPELDAEEL